MLARRSDESQTYASQSVLEAETDTIHIALIESNKVFIQPACALYFQQANWSLSFELSWFIVVLRSPAPVQPDWRQSREGLDTYHDVEAIKCMLAIAITWMI